MLDKLILPILWFMGLVAYVLGIMITLFKIPYYLAKPIIDYSIKKYNSYKNRNNYKDYY